ncbi:hypothetical protein GQR58_019525 [Nymphon striatum]|nr:hypothetical protein GQR58_019525 [Nymphon striatum]
MVEELRTASNKVGLEINLSKTKVMFNRNGDIQPIMTGNVALDQVDRYTYLGQLISIHRDWEPEGWRRKWIMAEAMFNLVSGQMAVKFSFCPEEHAPCKNNQEVDFESSKKCHIEDTNEKCCMILLEDIANIKRTSSSRTKQYAFRLCDKDGRVILNLSGNSESNSQEWLSSLHCIFWPPKSSVELQRVFSDHKEVSIIENSGSDKTLCGRFGFLSIKEDSITLVDPSSGETIMEWPLKQIRRFSTVQQNYFIGINFASYVFPTAGIKKNMYWTFSVKTPKKFLNSIEETIAEVMKKHQTSKQSNPSTIEDISNIKTENSEPHYDLPKAKHLEVPKMVEKIIRERYISVRLNSVCEESQYDVPVHTKPVINVNSAQIDRKTMTSVSSDHSIKSSSGSDISFESNSDNEEKLTKGSFCKLSSNSYPSNEVSQICDEVDGEFSKSETIGRSESININRNENEVKHFQYDEENIYEELSRYRKDLTKHFGIPQQAIQGVPIVEPYKDVSPPLPPRPAKCSISISPPKEHWFSNPKNLDFESPPETPQTKHQTRSGFHSYLNDTEKNCPFLNPKTPGSPATAKRTSLESQTITLILEYAEGNELHSDPNKMKLMQHIRAASSLRTGPITSPNSPRSIMKKLSMDSSMTVLRENSVKERKESQSSAKEIVRTASAPICKSNLMVRPVVQKHSSLPEMKLQPTPDGNGNQSGENKNQRKMSTQCDTSTDSNSKTADENLPEIVQISSKDSKINDNDQSEQLTDLGEDIYMQMGGIPTGVSVEISTESDFISSDPNAKIAEENLSKVGSSPSENSKINDDEQSEQLTDLGEDIYMQMGGISETLKVVTIENHIDHEIDEENTFLQNFLFSKNGNRRTTSARNEMILSLNSSSKVKQQLETIVQAANSEMIENIISPPENIYMEMPN